MICDDNFQTLSQQPLNIQLIPARKIALSLTQQQRRPRLEYAPIFHIQLP